MPKQPEKLWAWLLAQDRKKLLAILAVCAASTVDVVVKRHGAADHAAHAGELAEAVRLDMTQYWQPTAEGYFGRVSKGLILDAVHEGIGPGAAAKIAGLKKDAMAKRAETVLTGKGWFHAQDRAAPRRRSRRCPTGAPRHAPKSAQPESWTTRKKCGSSLIHSWGGRKIHGIHVDWFTRMSVGDWILEANKAQRTRQPLTRRGSRSLVTAEPLLALTRLLARQTAREVYRNMGGAARQLTDPT